MPFHSPCIENKVGEQRLRLRQHRSLRQQLKCFRTQLAASQRLSHSYSSSLFDSCWMSLDGCGYGYRWDATSGFAFTTKMPFTTLWRTRVLCKQVAWVDLRGIRVCVCAGMASTQLKSAPNIDSLELNFKI